MITSLCKHQQRRGTSLHATVRYLIPERTTQTIFLTPTPSWGDTNAFGGILCVAAVEWDKAVDPIFPQHTGIPTLASPGVPGPKDDGHSIGGGTLHHPTGCRHRSCVIWRMCSLFCAGHGAGRSKGNSGNEEQQIWSEKIFRQMKGCGRFGSSTWDILPVIVTAEKGTGPWHAFPSPRSPGQLSGTFCRAVSS